MREPPVPLFHPFDRAVPRRVEWRAACHRFEDRIRGVAGVPGRDLQPSIPLVGLEGIATSRFGIRPAK
jgi:hypothetical protein